MLSFGLAVGRVQSVVSTLGYFIGHFNSHFLSGFSSISSQVFNLTKLNWSRTEVGCWVCSGGYGEFSCACENFDHLESLKIKHWRVLPVSDSGLAEGLFCIGNRLLPSSLSCAQHRMAAAPSMDWRKEGWAGRCRETGFFHCLQKQSPFFCICRGKILYPQFRRWAWSPLYR